MAPTCMPRRRSILPAAALHIEQDTPVVEIAARGKAGAIRDLIGVRDRAAILKASGDGTRRRRAARGQRPPLRRYTRT